MSNQEKQTICNKCKHEIKGARFVDKKDKSGKTCMCNSCYLKEDE